MVMARLIEALRVKRVMRLVAARRMLRLVRTMAAVNVLIEMLRAEMVANCGADERHGWDRRHPAGSGTKWSTGTVAERQRCRRLRH